MRAVHRAIKDTDAPANLLDIELDTAAVLDDYGDARDNLEVLAEIGVSTGLCGFQGGPRELDLVADTAVSTITLGTEGAGAAGRDTASPVLRGETERLVRAIVAGGRECAVLDVHTEAEARWWAAAGVTTVHGARVRPAGRGRKPGRAAGYHATRLRRLSPPGRVWWKMWPWTRIPTRTADRRIVEAASQALAAMKRRPGRGRRRAGDRGVPGEPRRAPRTRRR